MLQSPTQTLFFLAGLNTHIHIVSVDQPSVTALCFRETGVMEAIVKPLRQTIGSN